MPDPNQPQGSPGNLPKPTQVSAPKTNPSTGRRETPAPALAPVDQTVVAAAVTAALAGLNQQRAATAPTPGMDKTVPGGVYIVDGQCVDCEGKPREHPDEDKEEADKEKP